MIDGKLVSRLAVPVGEIVGFCRRWGVSEFALFGSVLREDFGPLSDIDVFLTFSVGVDPTPDRAQMRAELEGLFRRPVDVTYRRVIEADRNYIIRRAILDSARVVYAA